MDGRLERYIIGVGYVRIVLALLFVGITALATVSASISGVQQRKADDQSAAEKVGTAFVWPDAGPAADPSLALRILAEAAETTHSNVIRTSIGLTEADRTQVSHYVLLANRESQLFKEFTLRSGRWPSQQEFQAGTAIVTNVQNQHSPPPVGVPSVPFDGYDLTFAGMSVAYQAIPASGRYVVESADSGAGDRFIQIVVDRLRQAGLDNLSSEDLRANQSVDMPDGGSSLDLIAWLLVAVAAFMVVYLLLRDTRRLGILRLNGYSVGRSWVQIVGRLQISVTVAALIVCLGLVALLPGVDIRLMRQVLLALFVFTMATLVGTFVAAALVLRSVRIGDLVKGLPMAGRLTIGILLCVGTASAVVFSVTLVQVWAESDRLSEQKQLASAWSGNRDYAVFYPRLVGQDFVELTSGGNASTIAEARDLYPILDSRGALFVESSKFENSEDLAQSSPSPLPPALRVNTNYLARYPILDESGRPISVSPGERRWVVAVPAQYKQLAPEIEKMVVASRNGSAERQGAIQAESRIVGPPPVGFAPQQVRIIWTAPGQQVFSFNQSVNPEAGSMITDPVVEVITPANSLTIDRFNSITGSIGTALKVKVDGDPARVLEELRLVLRALRLDDNLRFLVTPDEAALAGLEELRSSIARTSVVGGAAAVAVLGLAAVSTLTLIDRYRRTYAVRRLHGFALIGASREIAVILASSWVAQALFSFAAAGATLASGSIGELLLRTLLVVLTVVLIQLLVAVAVVRVLDIRSIAASVKDR